MTLIPHERIKSNIHRLVCKFYFLCDEATEEKKRGVRLQRSGGSSGNSEGKSCDEFLQIHWKFTGVILVEKREMEWSV